MGEPLPFAGHCHNCTQLADKQDNTGRWWCQRCWTNPKVTGR